MTTEESKAFVRRHFEEFVNHKDLSAADRNLAPDFFDHDGPGGQPTNLDGDKRMMAEMHALYPDIHVIVEDTIVEGDKVMCRNTWRGTDVATGHKVEFHGFVLWRITDGKLAERWATVTPPREVKP
jgi:predicted ester cyclase